MFWSVEPFFFVPADYHSHGYGDSSEYCYTKDSILLLDIFCSLTAHSYLIFRCFVLYNKDG